MDDLNLSNNTNYENDDFITFQLDSKTVNLFHSQFVKYSKLIREEYLFSDITSRFPHELHQFKDEYQISTDNIIYFFEIFQENCNIKKDSNLTYIQCIDLLKISKFLNVRKLTDNVNKYIKDHSVDSNFIIQMIQYEIQTKSEIDHFEIEINNDLENLLSSKIDECLSNKKFSELPISIIYRIIEKSPKKLRKSDQIFDLIKESISKFYLLFQFVEIQDLSSERFDELCELYSKLNGKNPEFFNCLKLDLIWINEIRERLNKSEEKTKDIQNQLDASAKKSKEQTNQITKIEERLKLTENTNNEQMNKLNELENQIKQMQMKLEESEKSKNELEIEKNQIHNQLIQTEKEKNQIHSQLIKTEKEKNEIGQKLEEEKIKNKGKIVASVKNGLIINAKIKLIEDEFEIDKSKSKYIISTSNEKNIGKEKYEKGEPITSLEMDTIDFCCKPGTYYVRCIVFDHRGKTTEIVSNPVTTNGNSILFKYQGKPTKITLFKGQYKLEVWGAKGGNSTGKRCIARKAGEGGLGGYSRGILRLKDNETIHVFVGGEGKSANSQDGSTTNGGFPDGGGTKTGHQDDFLSVPGTGGGSTSIRIKEGTNYARVIVAGGGGGASGSAFFKDGGGFGGGLKGGNCCTGGVFRNQGSGTQTGSTCGLGYGSHGDPGQFGEGATGKYKSGCDSGGGGGGGWYGGGSGGHSPTDDNWACSGGGGSGWTFTESSFNEWQSGDSLNASKFILDSSYYLTNTVCVGGDSEFPRPDGNGTERGHSGNGYAKITLE